MGSSRFNYILRCPVPIHISQITSHSVYFIHFIQFLTWHEWMDKWKPTQPKGSLEPFVYSSASVSKLKFGTNELLFFFCHTTNQNQTAHWLFFWCTQRTPLNHFSDSDHVNLYISFVYFYIFSRSYILGMSCRNRFWEEEKTPTQQFTYKHCRLCVCVCSHNISLPMLVTRIVSAFIFYFLVP